MLRRNTVAALAAIALAFAFSAAPARAATIIDVTFNTTALINNAGTLAPYGVFFTLTNGGPTGQNTVTITSFTGLTGDGSPSLTGGASGSIAAGIQLTDSSGILNDFAEGVTLGASPLTFTITIAEPIGFDGTTPDRLVFGFLVNYGTLTEDTLPTADPVDAALLAIDLKPNLTENDIHAYGNAPGSNIRFDAPTFVLRSSGIIPEPSTFALAGLGLVGVGGLALRRRRAAA